MDIADIKDGDVNGEYGHYFEPVFEGGNGVTKDQVTSGNIDKNVLIHTMEDNDVSVM